MLISINPRKKATTVRPWTMAIVRMVPADTSAMREKKMPAPQSMVLISNSTILLPDNKPPFREALYVVANPAKTIRIPNLYRHALWISSEVVATIMPPSNYLIDNIKEQCGLAREIRFHLDRVKR
jgi:hypothetical protein